MHEIPVEEPGRQVNAAPVLSAYYREHPKADATLQIMSSDTIYKNILAMAETEAALGGKQKHYVDEFSQAFQAYQNKAGEFSKPGNQEQQAKVPTQKDLDELRDLREEADQSLLVLMLNLALYSPQNPEQRIVNSLTDLAKKLNNDGEVLKNAEPDKPLADAVRAHSNMEPGWEGEQAAPDEEVNAESRNEEVLSSAIDTEPNDMYSDPEKDAILQIISATTVYNRLLEKAKTDQALVSKYVDPFKDAILEYQNFAREFSKPKKDEADARIPTQEDIEKLWELREKAHNSFLRLKVSYIYRGGREKQVTDDMDMLDKKLIQDADILLYAAPGEPIAKYVRAISTMEPYEGSEPPVREEPRSQEQSEAEQREQTEVNPPVQTRTTNESQPQIKEERQVEIQFRAEEGANPDQTSSELSPVYKGHPEKDAVLQVLSTAAMVEDLKNLAKHDKALESTYLSSASRALEAYRTGAEAFSKPFNEEKEAKIPTKNELETLRLLNGNAVKSLTNMKIRYSLSNGENDQVDKKLDTLLKKIREDEFVLRHAEAGKPLADAVRANAQLEPNMGVEDPRPAGRQSNPEENPGQRESGVYRLKREIAARKSQKDSCLQVIRIKPLADQLMEWEKAGKLPRKEVADAVLCLKSFQDQARSLTRLPDSQGEARVPDQKALNNLKNAGSNAAKSINSLINAFKGGDRSIAHTLRMLELKVKADNQVLEKAQAGRSLSDTVKDYGRLASDFGIRKPTWDKIRIDPAYTRDEPEEAGQNRTGRENPETQRAGTQKAETEKAGTKKPETQKALPVKHGLTPQTLHECTVKVGDMLNDLKNHDPWWMTSSTEYYQNMITSLKKVHAQLHVLDMVTQAGKIDPDNRMFSGTSKVAECMENAMTASRVYLGHKELDFMNPRRGPETEAGQVREQPRIRSAFKMYDGIKDIMTEFVSGYQPQEKRDLDMEAYKTVLLSSASREIMKNEQSQRSAEPQKGGVPGL